VDVTTREDARGSKARGSRGDYGLYGAVGVRLVEGNESVLCGYSWCVLRSVGVGA